MMVFSNGVCSTFTAMSLRTLLPVYVVTAHNLALYLLSKFLRNKIILHYTEGHSSYFIENTVNFHWKDQSVRNVYEKYIFIYCD